MDIYQYFMLAGGLGLFLYGMHLMSKGFELAAGERLRHWLSVLTNRRITGVIAGTGITAIIQSSSATSVMVVGFVNAGLMTLNQAIGVIMGANIGTTVTGLIIAFQLTKIAPIVLLAGVIMRIFLTNRTVNRWGLIVAGFGILFVGMQIMSDSMRPLSDMPELRAFMTSFETPVVGVLVGTLVTAVIQSSSASIGILQVMALEGLINAHSAFPLVLGMNIGTCVTALLASIGTNTNARRTAVMHLIMKIFEASFFLLISAFLDIPALIQSVMPGRDGAWEIAAMHTVFNIVNTTVLFPFGDSIVRLVEKLVPERDEPHEEMRLEFIDPRLFTQPTVVVAQLTQELTRMAELVQKNLAASFEAFQTRSAERLARVPEREKLINYLNHNITPYLAQAAGHVASEADRKIIGEMFHFCTDLERVGDHAENIMEYVQIILEHKLIFSEDAMQDAKTMMDICLKQFGDCVDAYFRRDFTILPEIETSEDTLNNSEEAFRDNHIKRLNAGKCDARSSMIFTDLLTDIERVGDHAVNILYLLKPHAD